MGSGTRNSHVTGGCVTASDIETIQSLLKPRRLDVVNRKKGELRRHVTPKKSRRATELTLPPKIIPEISLKVRYKVYMEVLKRNRAGSSGYNFRDSELRYDMWCLPFTKKLYSNITIGYDEW